MKRLLCFVLVCFSVFMVRAQAKPGGNSTKVAGQTSFFAELGGPGVLFSANIDRRFKPSVLGWGGRVGLGFVTAGESEMTNNPQGGYNYTYNDVSTLTVPLQINYIFGKTNSPHTFEVGAGATIIGKKLDILNFYDNKKTNLLGTFSFMYRRQPVDGGFSWRAGFTPLFGKSYIQPFGAVSVGYNF